MKKGVVLEKKRKHSIVLSADGSFHKIKNNNMVSVGEEVSFEIPETAKSSLFRPKLSYAFASFAMLLIIFFSFFQISNDTDPSIAYIAIDINPSLKLEVDEDLTVARIIPYNEDGAEVLKSINNWENKNFNEVTDLIIETSNEMGYLKENHEIFISINYKGEKDRKVQSKFEQNVSLINPLKHASIKIIEVDEKSREEADKNNQSPNKIKQKKAPALDSNKKESVDKTNQDNEKDKTQENPMKDKSPKEISEPEKDDKKQNKEHNKEKRPDNNKHNKEEKKSSREEEKNRSEPRSNKTKEKQQIDKHKREK